MGSMIASDRILMASSLGVAATALLPAVPISNPSLPFGLAVILHGMVFTAHSMTVGWSRFAAVNVLALLGGAVLHTITTTTLAKPSLPGYAVTLSGMAFLCFFYEMQSSIYGKTRKAAADTAEDAAPIALAGISLIMVRLASMIVMPIVILAAVTILGIALLIVLAPLF